jgi:hypothetical protein
MANANKNAAKNGEMRDCPAPPSFSRQNIWLDDFWVFWDALGRLSQLKNIAP